MPSGVYDRSDQSNWKPNSGRFKKGQHPSPETEFKKGVSTPNQFKKGEVAHYMPHGHGHFNEPEYILKQSISHRGINYDAQRHTPNGRDTRFKKGEHRSPSTEFKELVPGGISSEEMRFRNSPEYREWRKRVYKRDDFTCQRCGIRGGRLTAHHIEFFVTNPELRIDIDNGITLCRSCHLFEHSKLKILEKLAEEYQSNRRAILILRLETLEKYNIPAIVKERQTFISYSANPLTLQPLPKKKTQKAIIKELQLAFSKEVMPSAVK